MKKDIFYHGTNRKPLNKILKDGYLSVDYFGEHGVFLTKDIEDALNHGCYVFVFTDIDISNLSVDDVNDGYFYKGKLMLGVCAKMYVDPCDFRFQKDMFEYMIDKEKFIKK